MSGRAGTALAGVENAWQGDLQKQHSLFVTRALHAVSELGSQLSGATLSRALAAPDDYGLLLAAMMAGAAAQSRDRQEPVLQARLRGLERRRELVWAGGGLLSTGEVGRLLGMSRQGVTKRRKLNRLVAVSSGRRGFGYPRTQFEDGATLAGLEEALEALAISDGWLQLSFLVQPNDRLQGRTPAALLKEGRRDEVLAAAAAFGEHGAA